MNEVTVNKISLQAILGKNRAEHIAIYIEALVKFKEKLAGVLESLLQQVAEGKIPEYHREIMLVSQPECHTPDYDRAISMLEMEVNPTVKLNEHEFRCLVEDEWEWSRSWAVSNSSYTSHEKVRKFTKG